VVLTCTIAQDTVFLATSPASLASRIASFVGGSASETEAEASLSLLPGDARAVTGKIKERIVDTSILSLNEGGKKIVDCRKLQSVELIY
jgi:hypothetical protein